MWKLPRGSRKTNGSSLSGWVTGSGEISVYGPVQLSARATPMQFGASAPQPAGHVADEWYMSVVPLSKMYGVGLDADCTHGAMLALSTRPVLLSHGRHGPVRLSATCTYARPVMMPPPSLAPSRRGNAWRALSR